jgi:hypothetical protein
VFVRVVVPPAVAVDVYPIRFAIAPGAVVEPVPPRANAIVEPFHVPDVIVPTVASDERDVTASLTRVPVAGNVTEVLPDVTNATVCVLEPIVVLPLTVIVLPVFATPVPPYCPATAVPCHVPVSIVPTLVNEDPVTPEPSVVALSTDVPAIS